MRETDRKSRGSITVFLCMCMVLLIGVTGILLEGSRMYGCQAVLSMAKETAAQSVEADYNRELWEQYGLLLWDGQGGTEKETLLTDTYRRWLQKSLSSPEAGLYLYGMSVEEVSLKSYHTLLEQNGTFLLEQMLDEQESRYSSILLQMINDISHGIPAISLPEINISLDELLEAFTLYMVLPKDTAVSEYETGNSRLPSEMLDGSIRESAVEKILSCGYIIDHCSNYTDQKDQGMQYETEYILGGKQSDRLNLVSAARKIIKIRTALNLCQILSEEEMKQTAHILGLAISACLTIPEAEEEMTILVELVWAYLEAVQDVQDLYEGKCVSLQKDKSEWHIWISVPDEDYSLESEDSREILEEYLQASASENRENREQENRQEECTGNGREKSVWECFRDGEWNYECYLYVLLYVQNNRLQLGRVMDVIQLNLSEDSPGFLLENCCAGFSAELKVSVRPVFSALAVQSGLFFGRCDIQDEVSILFSNGLSGLE